MPLTEKDKKIMRSMKKTYGPEKGKQVFYASANKGTLGQGTKKRHSRRAGTLRRRHA